MSLFFKGGGEQRGQVTEWSDTGWSGVGEHSANRATYLGPVFASLRHITNYVSSLPIDSYWRNADSTRTPAPMPELLRNLESRFSIGTGPWFAQAAYGIAIDGNAVGWVADSNAFGHPTRIHWLAPTEWSFAEVTGQWYVFGHPVPRSRIFHIPWIVPPGCTLGLSPIEHYAATVSAGLSAQDYADIRRGGGIPPTTLKNEAQTIDAEQAARIEHRLVQKFATGRPFVHGKDWTFEAASIPPNHTQFIETLKLSANQIASAYGINPTEIGGEAGNSQEYANEEHREIRRAADMRPYLTRLEDAVSRILGERNFVRFDIDSITRVDLKTRTQVQEIEARMGKKSINEIRRSDDLAPVAGGDYYNVPAPNAEPTQRDKGETP